MSSEDDVHCDSLSGTALGASAVGVPPSVPVSHAKRGRRFVPWLKAGAVTLGGGDGEQTEVQVGLVSGQRIVSDGAHVLEEASLL
jgi:hypothetical protein